MLRPFVCLLILNILLFFPTSVWAQNALFSPIAVIESGDKYNREIGAAILLGSNNTELYWATAFHLVANPGNVQIELHSISSPIPGNIVQSEEKLDLAIISTPIPRDYEIPASFQLSPSGIQTEQTCTIIGHPLGYTWDINRNGRVKRLSFELDDRLFTLYPGEIQPGHSGGPVLSEEYHLLGMVLQRGPVNAVCLQSNWLLRACNEWGIPINLMTGIPKDKVTIQTKINIQERQYFLQIANTAFQNKNWNLALINYRKVYSLAPDTKIKSRIDHCENKLAQLATYNSLIKQASQAPDLQSALDLYRKAQEIDDNEDIRMHIRQIEQQFRKIGNNNASTAGTPIKRNYTDPFAGEMVFVEGGMFWMGSYLFTTETPVHEVQVNAFFLGKYEVTQEQWKSIMKTNPSSHMKCPKCPVENVSWKEARTFIKKLNSLSAYTYRLPSESEWEYAAGGGATNRTIYAGTNDRNAVYLYGNYRETLDENELTAEVGSYRPNNLGLYDMSGNVWEWCLDWYHGTFLGAPNMGSPWLIPEGVERVIKGGSWASKSNTQRVSSRNHFKPEARGNGIGFRLARTP